MFFLSYSGPDLPVARVLVRGLREAGLDVWFDDAPGAMVGGVPVEEQLQTKLQASRGMILLVGQRGVGRWGGFEVSAALQRHVREPEYRVAPLLLPGVEPSRLPPFIARFHARGLEGEPVRWGRQQFAELARWLKQSMAPSVEDAELPGGPFPGLERFDADRACFYFGRDQELRDAVARLGRGAGVYRRWLEIEGPSGVGKSSFVRAGLVPFIQGGWVEGAPERWRVAIMRPGGDPVHQLARALVQACERRDDPVGLLTQVEKGLRQPQGLRDFVAQRTPEGEGFLLVVDQLEELFTLSEVNRDVPRDLDSLLMAALERPGPLHLITTLRSDFLGRLDEMPFLSRAINAPSTARYHLSSLEADGLHQTLLGPAHLSGLRWEEGLPGRIIEDAEKGRGGLPLVAHVLRQLWERRDKGVLTHAAYEALGKVGGALTHSADALLDTFTPEERTRVRDLLLALVRVGRGMRDVRRTLSLSEAVAVAGGADQGPAILQRLSGGHPPREPLGTRALTRLLVVDEEQVDLIHEALLEQWRTLRDWLEQERTHLERREYLEDAARLWEKTGALPGRAQLEFLQTAAPVSALARALLAAGRAHEEQQRCVAQSRELTALALQVPLREDPQFSLRLLLEAHRLAPIEQTTDALLTWFVRRQRLCLRGAVSAAVFSPEGQCLLTAEGEMARFRDARSGALQGELKGSASLFAVAFSPEGRRILTGDSVGTVCLWDVPSRQLLAKLTGRSKYINKVSFSPEGRYLLAEEEDSVFRLWDARDPHAPRELHLSKSVMKTLVFGRNDSQVLVGDDDGNVRVWALPVEKEVFSFRRSTNSFCEATFSPEGKRVLIGTDLRHVRVHDAESGEPLLVFPDWVSVWGWAAFTPDGQYIFIRTPSGGVSRWDVRTGALLANFKWQSETILASSFQPEQSYFLSACNDDKTLRIRDSEGGEILAELHGHEQSFFSVSVSQDGRRVLSSGDGAAHVWEASLARLRVELHGVSGGGDVECDPVGQRILVGTSLRDATSGAQIAELHGSPGFSPNGRRILSMRHATAAHLWDAFSGQCVATLHPEAGLNTAVFSDDSQHVFTAHQDGSACLWDGSSGQLSRRLEEPPRVVSNVAFSPEGRFLLIGDEEGRITSWDVASGQRRFDCPGHFTKALDHTRQVTALTFSPDGACFLSGSGDRTARLWETASGKLLAEFPGHHDFINTTLFSPDGQRILTSEWEGTPRLWSRTSGMLLARLQEARGLSSAVFSPNGQRLLTNSTDKVVRLWDVDSSRLLFELRGHSDWIHKAVFSPTGRFVLTASSDHTARIWDASSGQCVSILRGHSGRGFSAGFSPTGLIVTASSEDGVLRLWDCDLFLSAEALVERARTHLFRELTEEERRRYLRREDAS